MNISGKVVRRSSELVASALGARLSRVMYAGLANGVADLGRVRHFEPSVLTSIDTDSANERLVSLAIKAASTASVNEVSAGSELKDGHQFLNIFPGEHYRILKALVVETGARHVVEIGTATGLSALALLSGSDDVVVTTYDVVPWDEFDSHLTPEAFGPRLSQRLGDLSQETFWSEQRSTVSSADIIFLDGPKDGLFEYALATMMSALTFSHGALLIVDDIRLVQMCDFWNQIRSPKLDLTSFGHWSGTGIVDLSDGLRLG